MFKSSEFIPMRVTPEKTLTLINDFHSNELLYPLPKYNFISILHSNEDEYVDSINFMCS